MFWIKLIKKEIIIMLFTKLWNLKIKLYFGSNKFGNGKEKQKLWQIPKYMKMHAKDEK